MHCAHYTLVYIFDHDNCNFFAQLGHNCVGEKADEPFPYGVAHVREVHAETTVL